MEFYANLHTHSTHSDGVYSPAELVRIAKDEGYKALAITDHDTVTAYPELKRACDEAGMDCIFGAEFTAPSSLLEKAKENTETAHLASEFHITAYHFDPEYPAMKQYLDQMSHRETDQTQTLFERGVKLGLLKGITWEDVLEYNKGIAWLCNDHVFRTMLAMGIARQTDYPQFFREVYGPYRRMIPPSYPFKQAEDIIQLIRDAGGIAVVAHPHKQLQHLDALMEMGIEGMEVWHPDLPAEEQEQALKLALQKGLYISGGSDHSGLCGGQYENYEDPTQCRHYIPPHSAGTTYEYFMEIKNRKITR